MTTNESKKVKIFFKTFRHDVNTGEDEITEDEYTGIMKKGIDGYFIRYEELSEEGKTTRNLITVRGGELQRKCMGEKSGDMTFRTGSETKSRYKTPYGIFDLIFHTSHMEITEPDGGLDVTAEYIMSVQGEPVADCRLKMDVRYE